MKKYAKYLKRAKELGAKEAKIIPAKSIVTAEWVRLKCQFGCDGYGASLCCPPHSPEPAETRRVLDSYRRAILFEAGLSEPKKIAVSLEREAFLSLCGNRQTQERMQHMLKTGKALRN